MLFRTNPARTWKRFLALTTAYILIIGTAMIVNLIILKDAWSALEFQKHAAYPYIALLLVAFIVFLIYELNQKIQSSSVPIGLVLSTVISLPILLDYFLGILSGTMVAWIIAGNVFSITLASYVFDLMWG